MDFRNLTPFPGLQFASRDEQKRDFGVVVLRGSFDIKDTLPLVPADEQEPLVLSDAYHGEPGKSSIRVENNIAPYKPKTDIHINAVAYAPTGRPTKGWLVTVRVGVLEKKLVVTGPRYWRHRLTGWALTPHEPCLSVPMQYENAFGGTIEDGDEKDIYKENMLGTGYVNKKMKKEMKLIRVPQIMSAKDPVWKLGKMHLPQGFGPISPAWLPRLKYAGTFDAKWEKSRWPDLPSDFKYDFFNSAHPDLIYPGFVLGNESVYLQNLGGGGEVTFFLPGLKAALLVRWADGCMAPFPIMLDTIHIDMPKMKTYLTWRGVFPLGKPIRVLEARLSRAEDSIS